MQTVEYMAQWRQFFAQLSYTYFKDGVYHITEPYGSDGEATIIRTANLDHRHYFSGFRGRPVQGRGMATASQCRHDEAMVDSACKR